MEPDSDATAVRVGAERWLLPALAGAAAALFLVALYLGLVTAANSLDHAVDLLWADRYLVGAIALGFGVQAGLYTYVRVLLRAEARALRSSTALTAAGTGTSTAAMVACCAHHVADVLPLVGVSGAAIFLNTYRTPLMLLGLGVNVVGVLVMLRVVRQTRQRVGTLGVLVGRRTA